jgi:hypothetical protein
MQTQLVIRYRTRPEAADLNESLICDVFAELADRRPVDVEYAVYRLDDDKTFVHVFSSSKGPDALTQLPAFQRFQEGAEARREGPADARSAHLVGRYASAADIPSQV